MQDRVLTARYVNADHTELEFSSVLTGTQRISRDGNPHAWMEVHRQAIVLSHDGTADKAVISARALDITPRLVTAMPSKAAVPQLAPKQPSPADLELKADIEMLKEWFEIEVAAEYAVVAMLPDGGVDPAKKMIAVEYLTQEAALRGTDLATLCISLSKARDERNRGVMAARLARLRGAN